MVQAKSGNYMVFFPSFRMLEDVGGVLERQLLSDDQKAGEEQPAPAMRLLLQRSGMSESEREQFLTAFSQPEEEGSLVGLCVMGSIFAEGIDLKGDYLIGAIVVGPGLPMISARQEILRKYYDDRGKDGFYYAYQCPGMSRVLQAAGRVIRTQDDAGCILLLDDRFAQFQYASMFPREWAGNTCCRLAILHLL